MRIGVEAFFLKPSHGGGKEQVLFNLLKGFQHIGRASTIHVFAYDYSADILKELIPDAEFTFVPYKNIFGYKTLNDSFLKTFRLKGLVKQHKIDVLFFPHYNTGLRKFKIPSVVLPHDIQTVSNPAQFSLKARMIYGLQYHFDFKLRTKIIAISDFDRSEIEKFYPHYRNKIERIYNPVDTDFTVPEKNNPGAPPYICAVNIAYGHKNTITLIRAFEKIMENIEHNLVLIGATTGGTEFLKTFVAEHKLGDRVRFTGFLGDRELHQVLCGAALFVNPSLFEGFGLPAIEAGLRCVPVISSMTGASVEVTKNLLNYYQPADDHGILAEKILEVLSQRQSSAELEAIRNNYLSSYAYSHISRLYHDFLTRLASQK